MIENEFDIKVRSLLEDAVEEVPAGVWEGVSGALDKAAAKPRRVAPVFWWRMTTCLAAAAAVVAVVLLWPVKKGDFGTVDNAAPAPLAKTEEPVAKVKGEIPSVQRAMTVEPERMVVNEVEVAEENKSKEEEVSVAEEVRTAETVEQVVEQQEEKDKVQEVNEVQEVQEVQDEAITNPFETQVPRSRKTPHLALTASGNAFAALKTNTTTHKAINTRYSVPRAKAPQTTGVTKVGNASVYGLPITAGLGVRYYVIDRFSIGSGIEYTYLGRTFSGTYNEVAVSANGDTELVRSVTSDLIHNDQHYLGIPLTFYYDMIKSRRVRAYAHAGGAVEKSVRCHYRIPSGSEVISYTEKVKGVQWSVGGGVGVEVRLTDYLGLYIDPGVKYYFKCNQPASLRTAQPLMMNINAGLRFDLGSRK